MYGQAITLVGVLLLVRSRSGRTHKNLKCVGSAAHRAHPRGPPGSAAPRCERSSTQHWRAHPSAPRQAPLALPKLAAQPARFDQPTVNVVLRHALCEHLRVPAGLRGDVLVWVNHGRDVVVTYVEDDEGRAVARRERRDGLEDTILRPGSLPVEL